MEKIKKCTYFKIISHYCKIKAVNVYKKGEVNEKMIKNFLKKDGQKFLKERDSYFSFFYRVSRRQCYRLFSIIAPCRKITPCAPCAIFPNLMRTCAYFARVYTHGCVCVADSFSASAPGLSRSRGFSISARRKFTRRYDRSRSNNK